MIAGIMEVVAEAHVLAEKSGISGSILENLIQQNFGALAYSDSQRMTQGIYCPGKGKYSVLSFHLSYVGKSTEASTRSSTLLRSRSRFERRRTRTLNCAESWGETKCWRSGTRSSAEGQSLLR